MALRKVKIQLDSREKEIELTDDALGKEIERAFKFHLIDERFDQLMAHALEHQRREDELTLRKEDAGLFARVKSSGFFKLEGVKSKFAPDEQNFNLLMRVRNALPAGEQESFFTKEGLGGRLLAEVARQHHIGGITDLDDSSKGAIPDYLRRIGSIINIIPEPQRRDFLTVELPKLLDKSKSYREFLENTVPYVEKHLKRL